MTAFLLQKVKQISEKSEKSEKDYTCCSILHLNTGKN